VGLANVKLCREYLRPGIEPVDHIFDKCRFKEIQRILQRSKMNITSAESVVMEVLWRDGPRDAEEIVAALADSQGWSTTTVRTLLDRLIKKGAVAKAKEAGKPIVFTAVVRREDYTHAESKTLIDRLYEGRLGPMFAQFSQRERLTDEDIAELKAIIARIEDER
jgi:BlaI family transcriptional regulator, penicillinase repressor